VARKPVLFGCALVLAWSRGVHADLHSTSTPTGPIPPAVFRLSGAVLHGSGVDGMQDTFADQWLARCAGMDCFPNELRPAPRMTESSGPGRRRSSHVMGVCVPTLLGLGLWHLTKARRQLLLWCTPADGFAGGCCRVGPLAWSHPQCAQPVLFGCGAQIRLGALLFIRNQESSWWFEPLCFLIQSSPRAPPGGASEAFRTSFTV
jgi:hypothetical protein